MKFKQVQIVKIGTQALFRENDRIDINKINDLGHDVKVLRDHHGIMSILVTSGAISLGKMAQSLSGLDDHILQARAAASIGQLHLMDLYKLSIGEEIAQIMPTHHSLLNEDNRLAFEKMMRMLVGNGVFPVVNYNDTVDDYELQHISNFADNDKLTETLALMLKVDRVVILSDVDGFMDGEGNLIEKITFGDDFDKLRGYCDGKSNRGTGGMISKLDVANTLMKNGVEMIIGNSKYPLVEIVNGKRKRTVFQAN